jgi:two-component system sensor histidine kinase KdpD
VPNEARRPDPDALLAHVAAEEAAERGGKLKVFLGAAPGVGKTYAMLGAAQELRKQGVDVVVGLVESHGRPETEALLAGLESVSLRQLPYRGKEFEELDLDALLRRKPRVALVDELAHTNVPGARHERRWQDVEELLDAGIDVYTTLNVQHIESLNDVVARATGVRVRETVPDAFLDRLRDVVLVDLPPRELIERLRQGKVYVPERARAALDRYFSPSNLTVLRELAMRAAAERVDAELRAERAAFGERAMAPGPRLVVAVEGHEHAEDLVRFGRRMAERRHAPWTVVHVETDAARARTDREQLSAAFQLARRLGGETAILQGSNVADELLDHARRHGAGGIVIGSSSQGALSRLMGRGIAQRLVDRGAHLELTIVSTPAARRRSRRRAAVAPDSRGERWREIGIATGIVALAVGICALVDELLPVASLALVFLCAVLVVAVRTRRSAAAYAAALSFLAYNFFFTEPRYTFRILGPHDVVAVFSFLAAALLAGHLASRLRTQVVRLRAANEHARTLQALGERLAAAADAAQVYETGCVHLAESLGCEAVAMTRDAEGSPLVRAAAHPPRVELAANDLAAADWVAAHAQPAGRYTATLAASPWWFLPLAVEGGCLGAIGLRFAATPTRLADEQRHVAEAIVQQVALAADRTRLVHTLEHARIESETERLRTALLSSISHDLRSPLASVIGAASSLSAYGDSIPDADRRELLDSIRSEGERLDRYVQNLLDMTRLGSGPLKLERDWVGLDEILSTALARLRKLFPDLVVQCDLPTGLPPLFVHPALVEQALFNVLENAAKFSPPGEAVTVRAGRDGDRLRVDVVDRGPGIPEAERKRIFDLFFTAPRGDRGARGTGLGLTIVRGMIGAHGGRVEALPGEGGRGTTIRITLPVAEPPAVAGAEGEP